MEGSMFNHNKLVHMKKNILFVTAVISMLAFVSCEDFLDRTPQTEITKQDFFKTAQDLETYSNYFYKYLKPLYDDVGSDNVAISTNANDMYTMVNSNGINSTTIKYWDRADWEKLRGINYMLENIDYNRINAKIEDIRHYEGIAKFFRADFYYNKVKLYSAVPWYNKALDTEDESMYKPSDPRTLVVDSVLRDLQFAVTYIKEDLGSRTRINRYAALQLMARICLHEGTFRKYHTSLGLQSTAETFFDKAIWAAEEIMTSGKFEVYGNSAEDYGAMFCSSKLNNNKEMILVEESDEALGKANNTHTVLGDYWGLSRSLMLDYQMKDGTPYSDLKPDGTMKSYIEMFEDRDPRFVQTFVYPGFKESPQNKPYMIKLLRGGLIQLKYYPKDENQRKGWNRNYTSIPIFRYGEVLLIYAEAKAEKGNISQDDLNRSVNLLRTRAEMPDITLSGDIINDIRRERRVELACEGLRLDDIKRWAQGESLGRKPQGIYIHGLGAFDTTGDGVEDVAILPNPSDESSIAHLPESVKSTLVREYLINDKGKETGIYLSDTDGKSGFLEFTTSRNRKWEDKFYYIPIPKRQIQLNPSLIQPPGWENE